MDLHIPSDCTDLFQWKGSLEHQHFCSHHERDEIRLFECIKMSLQTFFVKIIESWKEYLNLLGVFMSTNVKTAMNGLNL